MPRRISSPSGKKGFRSKAQRSYMWKMHPEAARTMELNTSTSTTLPYKSKSLPYKFKKPVRMSTERNKRGSN